MGPNDDLSERLRATFVQELDEHVQQLNAALLALERRPRDDETVRTLFRAAHTVKGAARVAGVPLIEEACHALESVFAAVRSGERALSGADFSLLFATVDALADAGARLRADRSLDGAPLESLLPRILDIAGVPVSRPARQSDMQVETGAEPQPPTPPRTEGQYAPQPQAQAEPEELVRVRADRLDALLSAVGELTIATGRIVARSGAADDAARTLERVADDVTDVVHRLRLRPLIDVFEPLPRLARDIAAAEEKQVELLLEGQDVEADRLVVDALRDPLVHLVRNAVDHGIEPPDARQRAGKPRTGRVTVAAEMSGGRLVVSVADDGAGLDEQAIRAALRERGQPEPRNRQELAHALLAGGFSTLREATAISGRGVGVDVVRSRLERIGGTLDVEWQAGRGTRFVLECPPRPALLRAVLVRLGNHTFALPTAHVERLLRVQAADLRSAEGRTVLQTARGPIPLHSLPGLLGPPLEARPLEGTGTVVIVSSGTRRAALLVDEVLDEDEIVVRPLSVDAGTLPWAVGAAVLPSGSVALVLATGPLLARAAGAGTAIAPAVQPEREAPRRRILVADDSITTRTLEQSVLEAAGYEVMTAVDGEDAWQRLDREGADAIVADVEMPRMDGFSLCRRIRASGRFAALPVVLVTGLASAEDRARGMEAGADAYIVKSGFDQASLLETVNQLVGDT